MPPPADGPQPGLRERKKARTRAEIQRHALRLFRERGYEATTVSEIAEAAEVSQSTFFRYFPAKEDVVLTDDFDEPLWEAFMAQPSELSPAQAMRQAVRAVLGELGPEERAELRERTELIFSVPELKAAMAGGILDALQQACELVAARTGRSADDLGVRALAGALLGAIMAVTLAAVGQPDADYVELIDAALERFEHGFNV